MSGTTGPADSDRFVKVTRIVPIDNLWWAVSIRV
jgi:hypothetical protein